MAVGRKRPPLCRGCAPATPPSKTIPSHRLTLFPNCPLSTVAPPSRPCMGRPFACPPPAKRKLPSLRSPFTSHPQIPISLRPDQPPIPPSDPAHAQITAHHKNPPPNTAHAQITVHHENPTNHSSDKIPNPPTNPAHAQITVHHENPTNHSSDKIPPQTPPTRKSQPITKIPQITVQTKLPNPPQTPHTRKSQPITKIPKITVQTKSPIPPQTPPTRNHSPSQKSPKITVQTKSPHQPRTRANHSPSRKSNKSQFRQNPQSPHKALHAQITVHHENPTNHSSDKSPKITVQTKIPIQTTARPSALPPLLPKLQDTT